MTNTPAAPTARVQIDEIVTDMTGDRWVRFAGSLVFTNTDQDDDRLTRAELVDRYGPLTPHQTAPAVTRLTMHDPAAPEMGQRVSAVYRGQAVTGAVTSRAFGRPVEGVHPLESVHLHLDSPITSPSGRKYDRIYLATAEALASVKVL